MAATGDDFSKAFYPFLHEGERAPAELMEELRFSLLEKSREGNEVKDRFFDENKNEIVAAALTMARAFHRGHRMFVCGNGGSATDAQHVAVEFMHPITVGRKALPVVSLANDTAMLTAVANDVGIAQVFSRQLIAHAQAGDLLLAISTSGNSANLMDAFETARRMKVTTVGFAGGDGGQMRELHARGLLDFCLVVPTPSIHRVQETHVALYHIIWDLVHELLPHRALMEETG